MVAKKKAKKVEKKSEDNEKGMSLDDAFGDDEDVEYAPTKPAKVKKKVLDEDAMDNILDEAVGAIEKIGSGSRDPPKVNASKPVAEVKKGDKMKIDGVEMEVDAHYELIDHGNTREMAIEVFDKNDKDYQIRYFDDQVEGTLEVYELQEIIYLRKAVKKVEW